MQWQDEAIVLSSRPFGERALLVRVLALKRGCHAGLVYGVRRSRAIVQPGNRIHASWRARLDEQLGHFSCSLNDAVSARIMHDGGRLAALFAACSLADKVLPERDFDAVLYQDFTAFLEHLEQEQWPQHYIRWEMALLAATGFGLDLDQCVVSGRRDDLVWVSPRSGRAVSDCAAGRWRDRLLAMPPFLAPGDRSSGGATEDVSPMMISQGLTLTGYFLEHRLLYEIGQKMPFARRHLSDFFI